MTFPKWFEKNGERKLFSEQPTEVGWEPANGHYDFARGVWIDDEPAKPVKAEKPEKAPADDTSKDDIKALRAEYQKKTGKKPFTGWSADQLREKMAAA